jgi:hypothetical protein
MTSTASSHRSARYNVSPRPRRRTSELGSDFKCVRYHLSAVPRLRARRTSRKSCSRVGKAVDGLLVVGLGFAGEKQLATLGRCTETFDRRRARPAFLLHVERQTGIHHAGDRADNLRGDRSDPLRWSRERSRKRAHDSQQPRFVGVGHLDAQSQAVALDGVATCYATRAPVRFATL